MADADQPVFWDEAQAIIVSAPIAFLASAHGDQPLVRAVTPAYEGTTVYIATDRDTPKVRQIERNPLVNLIHWAQDFRHVSLRARAALVSDPEVLERLWEAFPYALSDYFDRADPPAEGKASYGLLCLQPFRIEVGSLGSLAMGKPPQVWRDR
jgi:uncharacterized pyridoxamine 5'-phosphate oxidase family protein